MLTETSPTATDFSDCFSYSLPLILDNVVNILQKLVIQINVEGPTISDEEQKIDDELKSKTEALFAKADAFFFFSFSTVCSQKKKQHFEHKTQN